MAKFRVKPMGSQAHIVEGEYKITEGGVLSVLPKSGPPVIYGPSGWATVEVVDAPEKAAPGNTLYSDKD